MTDRELLELAAKAVGIKVLQFGGDGYWTIEYHERGMRGWNPLIDDGDALRLAVKLCIDVGFGTDNNGGFVCALVYGEPTYANNDGNDPYEATRRAIVRAAAEIGWSMP